MENENIEQKKVRIPRVPKIDFKAFPGWIRSVALGWREYFVSFPTRVKKLTRREIRVKVARYLYAIVVTYFVVGVIFGFGFYLKQIPLNSQIGFFGANIYPFPAEIVGLNAVTLKDIADQEKIIYYFADASGSSLGDRLEVDSKVMESLEEVRLAQKGLAQYGLKVSNKDVDEVMDQIEEENGGAEQVEDLLQSLYGLSTTEFRGIVSNQLAKDKINSEVLKTVKVRHILLDSEETANEVKGKIENGEISFEDAAKEYSKDTNTKETGGLVVTSADNDFVGRDSGLAQEFVDAAYGLEAGALSSPVQTEFGWHIIRVDETKGSVDMNYADWLSDIKSKTLIWRWYRP